MMDTLVAIIIVIVVFAGLLCWAENRDKKK